MTATYQLLETLQSDLVAILQNTPALANANIIREGDGDLESRVQRVLTLQKDSSGGKRGLAVIVMLPEVTTSEPNLPGPTLLVKVSLQVLEHVQINRGSSGSGIRSSQAALIALAALHHQQIGSTGLYADTNPMEPLPVNPGLVSHAVTLFFRETGMSPAKTLPVTAAVASPPATAASTILDPAGTDNALRITAVETGTAGNDITVEIASPAVQAITDLGVVGDAITVTPGAKARMTIGSAGTLTPDVTGELFYAGLHLSSPHWTSNGLSYDSNIGTSAFSVVLKDTSNHYIQSYDAAGNLLYSSLSTSDVTWPDDTNYSPAVIGAGTPTALAGATSAAQVIAAINAFPAAAALVTASASGSGTGAVAAVAATNLSGGAAGATLTLTTASAGAAIYHTADGSYPTPAAGTLYAAPFALPAAGTYLRTAAYAPDLNPSDCLEFTVTE